MRVRCTATALPAELQTPLLAKFSDHWPVSLNAEYDVFALSQRGGLWYVIIEMQGRGFPVSVPLALFEIVEPEVPTAWNVRVEGHHLSFRPTELDDEYFVDDVQERRGDAFERYARMKERLAIRRE